MNTTNIANSLTKRQSVKNYKDILNDFSMIENVTVLKNSVIVQGLCRNERKTESYKYSNNTIAKHVAQKVNYFKGIK